MKKNQDYTANPGLIEDLCQNSAEEHLVELPGQVCVPASRHLRNDFKMNSPGDLGEHSSAFTGMYESDSNYRWRKVKGNLDLFVMERNERHLTSLQWKFQKMSKSRRRTPVYEGFCNDSQGDDVYKQMPESARTRSRAESRQRMREDLDAYFYGRWKNADNKQKKNINPQEKADPIDEDSYYKSKKDDKSSQNEFNYKDTQHRGGGDPSKWSRYGYNPNFSNPFNNFPPGYYNNPFSNRNPGAPGDRRPPNDHFRDPYRQAEYTDSNPPSSRFAERPEQNPRTNDGHSTYFKENEDASDPYWRDQSRYPQNTYSPREQAYSNYGYAPEYCEANTFSPMHDNHHGHGYPTQFHPHPMNNSVYNNYNYSRPPNHEPWLKKQHPSRYPENNRGYPPGDVNTYENDCAQDSSPGADEGNNSAQETPSHLGKVDQIDRCMSRRTSRVGIGSETAPPGHSLPYDDTTDYNNKRKTKFSKKMNGDRNALNEANDGDDDVFFSNTSSARQSSKAKDNFRPRQTQENSVDKNLEHNNLPAVGDNGVREEFFVANHGRVQEEPSEKHHGFGYHPNSHSDVNLPNQAVTSMLYYNSRPMREPSGTNDAEMNSQTIDPLLNLVPTNPSKLPPLQAEHLASVRSFKNDRNHSMKSTDSMRSRRTDIDHTSKGKRTPFTNENWRNDSGLLSKPGLLEFDNISKSVESSKTNLEKSRAMPTVSGEKTPISILSNPSTDKFLEKKMKKHPANDVCNDKNGKYENDEHFGKPSPVNQSLSHKQELSFLAKRDREVTTIHVGDIDAASPTPTASLQSRHQATCAKDPSSSLSDKTLLSVTKEATPLNENGCFETPLKADENTPLRAPFTKSKTTLWKLAKSLQRRMATKLSLRREKSKLISISTEPKSLRASRSSLRASLSSLRASRSSLRASRSSLRASRSSLRASRSSLRVSRPSLRASRSSLRASRSSQRTSRSSLRVSRPSLSASRSSLRASRSSLRASRSSLRASRSSLRASRSSFRASRSSLRSAGSGGNDENVPSRDAIKPKQIPETSHKSLEMGPSNTQLKPKADLPVNRIEKQSTSNSLIDDNNVVAQPLAQPETNERTSYAETSKLIENRATTSETSNSSVISVGSASGSGKENDENGNNVKEMKHFFEEEMKLEEQRKKNEDLANHLLKDQHEMEFELHNLRKMLNAEMRRQEDTNCVNDRFNQKIEDIERQIEQLDEKLSETTDKLKQNKLKKEEITNRMACERENILPPNPPLFIISDPHNGTAAALTQGACPYDSQSSSTPNQRRVAPFFGHPPYSSSEMSPYSIRRNSNDVTMSQQEKLKVDLETQMAAMKVELQNQLDEQREQTGLESKNIINARVANLEEQIEEMKQKIESAETSIKKAELKKQEKTVHHEDSETPSKTPDRHTPVLHRHTPDLHHQAIDVRAAQDHKYFKPKLSLSPKVTPARLRKHGENDDDDTSPRMDHCDLEKRYFQDEKDSDVIDVHSDESQSDDDVMIIAENSFTKDRSTQPLDLEGTHSLENNENNNSAPEVASHTECLVTAIKPLEPEEVPLGSKATSIKTDDEVTEQGNVTVENDVKNLDVAAGVQKEQKTINSNKPNVNDNESVSEISENKISIVEKKMPVSEFLARTPEITNLNEETLLFPNIKQSVAETKASDQDVKDVDKDPESTQDATTTISPALDRKSELPVSLIDSASEEIIRHERTEQENDNASVTISSEAFQDTMSNPIMSCSEQERQKSLEKLATDKQKDVEESSDIILLHDLTNDETDEINTQLILQELAEVDTESVDAADSKKIDKLNRFDEESESSESTTRQSSDDIAKQEAILVDDTKLKIEITGVAKENKPNIPKPTISHALERLVASSNLDDKKEIGSEKFKGSVSLKSSKLLTSAAPSNLNSTTFSPTYSASSSATTSAFEITSHTNKRDSSSILEKYKQKRQFAFMATKPTPEKQTISEKTERSLKPESNMNKVEGPSKPNWNARLSFIFKSPPKRVESSSTPSRKDPKQGKPKEKTEERKNISKKPSMASLIKINELFSNKNKKNEKLKKEKTTKLDLPKPPVDAATKPNKTKSKETTSSRLFGSFTKTKRPPDLKLQQFSPAKSRKDFTLQLSESGQDTPQSSSNIFKKHAFKTSSFSFRKPHSNVQSKTSSSNVTSDVSSSKGGPSTYVKSTNKSSNASHKAVTITSVESEFSEVYEDISQIEPSTTHTASTRRTGRGWDLHKLPRCHSILYGMGTNWCVCPERIWKYLGNESDDESITRRKCISLIMGAILAALLLAVVIGLIIGLAFSEGPTESPIRFVVIPGEDNS